jgi:CheY-like chemotaxis protein
MRHEFQQFVPVESAYLHQPLEWVNPMLPDPRKLVLMLQPTQVQGAIWQAVLRSQQISIIWESPKANLVENLKQLRDAQLNLPDLLLIDVRLRTFNPFDFCRWCRAHYPEVKVILVDGGQREVFHTERQWAMNQGAADLLPGFQLDNLMNSVSTGLKQVLRVLGNQNFDNGSLVTVLLAIKRELDIQRSNHSVTLNGTPTINGIAMPPPSSFSSMDSIHPIEGQLPKSNIHIHSSIPQNGATNGSAPPNSAPVSSPKEKLAPQENQPLVRKYRGHSY